MGNALAIGFFDGVHLGHRAILEGAGAVLTFANHPLTVLAPARAPKLLMSTEERLAAIRGAGPERVVAVEFTRELSELSPEEFVGRCLKPELARSGAGTVRCGANWRFGRGGSGDADTLRSLGLGVEVSPFVVRDGLPVSSSRIRAALGEGRLAEAAAMLGRSYRLSGRVVPGKGLGRELGFPTVNLEIDNRCPPLASGVYAVAADGRPAIANFGRAPTLKDRAWERPVLEVHFLGEPSASISFAVEFRRFIRPERAFASLEELKAQIARDVAGIAEAESVK